MDNPSTQSNTNKSSTNFFKMLFFQMNCLEVFLFFLGIIGSIIVGIAIALADYISFEALDKFGLSKTPEEIKKNALDACIVLLIIAAFVFFGGYFMSFFFTFFGKKISNRYKNQYFQFIMRKDQAWFDNMKNLEVVNKFILEMDKVEKGSGVRVSNLILEISGVIVCLVLSFRANWKITLVLIILDISCLIASTLMSISVQRSAIKQQEISKMTGGHAEELLYQIKTVTAFGNYPLEINTFMKNSEEYLKYGFSRAILSGINVGLHNFFSMIVFPAGFGYGAYLLLNGEKKSYSDEPLTSFDVLISVNGIALAAYLLLDSIPNIKAVVEACLGVTGFFELRKEILEELKNRPILPKTPVVGNINFEKVSFSYKKNNKTIKVLNNFNASIEENKMTAIIGESGCGKSTIVNLIMRLYNSDDGEIKLNEAKIDLINLEHYRSHFGYVSQEPVLFNDTIRNNILFGREGYSENHILEACKLAKADEVVNKFEEGLDHIVGVKGGKLSGGQKQRIAIARALLSKPKFLILDEATSSLDNESEKEIHKSLNLIKNNAVTIIMIAHRLSTVINCDKIILLGNGGKIIEQGTHEELISLNGTYSNLLNMKNRNYDSDENNSGKLVIQADNENVYVNLKSDNHLLSKRNDNDSFLIKNNIQNVKEKKFSLYSILKNHKLLLVLSIIFGSSSAVYLCMFPLFPMFGDINISDLEKMRKAIMIDTYGILGLSFGVLINEIIKVTAIEILGDHISLEIKNKVFSKLLSLPIQFFDHTENNPGHLIAKLNTNISSSSNAIMNSLALYVQMISGLIIGYIFGLVICWQLALIQIALSLSLIISNIFYKMLTKNDSINNSEFTEILSDFIMNTLTVFSYNSQENAHKLFKSSLKKSENKMTYYSLLKGFFYGLSQTIYFIQYGIFILSSGTFIADGTTNFDTVYRVLTNISISNTYILFFQKYSLFLSGAKEDLDKGIKLINLESPNNINEDLSQVTSPLVTNGKIEFKNVNFKYPVGGKNIVLKNLSFKIESGKTIGFIGASGSGKSTIVQLIERFYDIESGEILIDGININDFNLHLLRKSIGYVQQEPMIFKTNVLENIKYGKLEASDNEIQYLAKNLEIKSDIIEIDENLIVSGGEKQRIAIARALIRNPKILLLDEATSALDNKTEKDVLDFIQNNKKNMTIIIIAHKLSTVEKCDHIFYLENGEIVEEGTHEELYDKKGKYYHLKNLQ